MSKTTTVARNRPLSEVLHKANHAELEPLADLLTDGGSGRLALDRDVKEKLVEHWQAGTLPEVADVVSDELLRFAGNSLTNLVRGRGVEYRVMAKDAAERAGADLAGAHDDFALEAALVAAALGNISRWFPHGFMGAFVREVERLSRLDASECAFQRGLFWLPLPASRPAQSASSGNKLAAVLGHGASQAGKFVVARKAEAAAVVLGSAYASSTEATRITVPAVFQIARIRRRQMDDEFAAYARRIESWR